MVILFSIQPKVYVGLLLGGEVKAVVRFPVIICHPQEVAEAVLI